jgi:hypothetical protein
LLRRAASEFVAEFAETELASLHESNFARCVVEIQIA